MLGKNFFEVVLISFKLKCQSFILVNIFYFCSRFFYVTKTYDYVAYLHRVKYLYNNGTETVSYFILRSYLILHFES